MYNPLTGTPSISSLHSKLALRTSSSYERLGRIIPALNHWLRLRHYRPPIRGDLARIFRSTYRTLGFTKQNDVGVWRFTLHCSLVGRERRVTFVDERA